MLSAGIDVFEVEPPDKWNPLFKLDNVIVSPHNAALTKEEFRTHGCTYRNAGGTSSFWVKPNWAVNEPLTKGSVSVIIQIKLSVFF